MWKADTTPFSESGKNSQTPQPVYQGDLFYHSINSNILGQTRRIVKIPIKKRFENSQIHLPVITRQRTYSRHFGSPKALALLTICRAFQNFMCATINSISNTAGGTKRKPGDIITNLNVFFYNSNKSLHFSWVLQYRTCVLNYFFRSTIINRNPDDFNQDRERAIRSDPAQPSNHFKGNHTPVTCKGSPRQTTRHQFCDINRFTVYILYMYLCSTVVIHYQFLYFIINYYSSFNHCV